MTLNQTNILLRHNYVVVPFSKNQTGQSEALATVLMNLSYYGYGLNIEGYEALCELGAIELSEWWNGVETELKEITGAGRQIGDFVVYKNFPAEVLNKSDAQYWMPQILMYWGFPASFFTEPVQPREKIKEQPRVTVLRRAKAGALQEIWESLLKSPARWKDHEFQDVIFLAEKFPVNFDKLAFKENLVRLAVFLAENSRKITISTATDVLRLAAGLSDGDVSLREKVKFKSFKKPMRRFLLGLLEDCANLAEDVARREELWKRFFHHLHPGDYRRQFPKVCEVMDDLYNDRLVTFNAQVEALLKAKNPEVLVLLATRPGEFRRRLVHTLGLFGDRTVKAFVADDVLSKLTTVQVVTLRRYLDTVNERFHRCFPPKGNWNKLQLGEARWVEERYLLALSGALGEVLATRVPKVKFLDSAVKLVKLPNNGETGPYARGTVFPIPEDVEFIRTASYWRMKDRGTVWFDNGWNFFDDHWKSKGAICWNEVKFKDNAAAFSGDPLNSKDVEGRAAQLIDLYPAKLTKQGIRYAVWNIMCFSRIPFSKAEDVFAALQWGQDAQKGGLFDPARNQLSFALTGDGLTKFVCVIDLVERKMIYVDANLKGDVTAAGRNNEVLEKTMPAFMEYLNSLPSVHDLFVESVDTSKEGGAHILYSDRGVELTGGPAYVFRPENKANKFKLVDLNGLLI